MGLPLVGYVIGTILGVTVLQWLVTELASTVVAKSPFIHYLEKLKDKINKNSTFKTVTILVSVAMLFLGTWQVIRYFLFNGPYLWFIILSLGLYLILFILPWITLVLPFKKKFKTSSMILLNLSTGLLLVWMTALQVTSNTIYLDESGGRTTTGNPYLKTAAVIVIGLYYVFSLGMLIVANQSYKKVSKEKSNKD